MKRSALSASDPQGVLRVSSCLVAGAIVNGEVVPGVGAEAAHDGRRGRVKTLDLLEALLAALDYAHMLQELVAECLEAAAPEGGVVPRDLGRGAMHKRQAPQARKQGYGRV